MMPWQEVKVTVPGLDEAHVHFETPDDELVRAFDIRPDYLLVASILVRLEEQIVEGLAPLRARDINGASLVLPRGRVTLKLRNPEKLAAFATVRALT